MAVTFPTTHLVTGAYIALGADLTADPATWSWTDISDYVRHKPGVRLRMHRTGEGAAATTCTASLTLANDGRFSRRKPSSPYFGLLTMNTPIRLTIDVGEGEITRYEGFVNEWPRSWDISGRDSIATISCSGVMRRPVVASASATLKSAPRRWIPTTTPLTYWSLEDGELVDQGEPDVGTRTMVGYTGIHPSGATISPPRWWGGQLAPWLPSVLSLSGNDDLTIAWALADMPTATTTWTLDYYYGGGDLTVDINPGYLTGGLGWPQLRIASIDRLVSVSMNAEPETSITLAAVADGRMHHVRWTVSQSAAKVAWTVYIDGTSRNTGTTTGDMVLPLINKLGLAAVNNAGTVTVGHVALWTGTPPSRSTAVQVMNGYAGEQAHVRIGRICDEVQIPFNTPAGTSAVLGPESYASPLSRMRDAEAVDGGVLYEDAFGLAYQSLRQVENASVALALDFDSGHIGGVPRPTDDDQRIRNRWTIARRSGSTDTVEVTDGAMGSAATGPGYEGAATLNLFADTQILDQAGWRCNLGTVDEDRWPSLPLRFHRTPSLINDFVDLHPGSRVTAAHPPAEVAPDTIDAIVEGWTERWDSVSYEAAINTSPSRPYRIGLLASTSGDTADHRLRLIPDTCELVDAVNTSATSWLVFTDPLWTTDADDLPCDLVVGGERVRLTAQAYAVTDGFSRVTAGGWGTATTGQSWTVVPGGGGSAANFTTATSPFGQALVQPASTGADYKAAIDVGGEDRDVQVEAYIATLPASGQERMGVIGRYLDTSNNVHAELQVPATGPATLRIVQRLAGTMTVLTSTLTGLYIVADTKYTIRCRVVGTHVRARAWLTSLSEPPWWIEATTGVTTGDSAGCFVRNDTASTAHIFKFDNLLAAEPRVWTVTRSINGISKSHSAGDVIEIADPHVLGL